MINNQDPPNPPDLGLEATAVSKATIPTIAVAHAATHAAPSSAPGVAPTGPQRPRPDYPAFVAVDPEHYVLAEEIARGGMGRIRMARDRRLGRAVAIKEILVKDADLAARFEREARITARLQHPSIVNVHEAGVWPTGEPFFAMKLVSGRSLDQVIAGAMTLEARLALLPSVLAVADAMAYAHAQGVIHRDLKPTNVLIGEYGETVVIDWGLAKDLAVVEELNTADGPYRRSAPVRLDGQTEVGAIVGTPAYMPVEQALGEAVDQRTDVYSLGALLFHVLSGRAPVAGRSLEEILAKILAGPLPSLAHTQLGVPPDLLAIVAKAMAFESVDRYPSALELAEDLRRFQTGQLVGAHRYSLGHLVRRWVRRHRAAVSVAAIAVTLLVGVGVVSFLRIVRAERDAKAERHLAVLHRADAEELMDFMLFDLKDKLQPIGRVDLLDVVATKATAYYERQPLGQSDDERHRRAVALRNLGDVLVAQGNSTAALKTYRAVFAIAEPLAASNPTNANWQRALAVSHKNVGDVLLTQNAAAETLREYRAALTIAENLAARDPSNTGWQGDLSVSHESVGDVLKVRGDAAAALTAYRTALAIRNTLAAREPTSGDRQRALVISRKRVGEVLESQGDAAGALAEYRAALAIAKALAARDATNAKWQHDLALSHSKVGDVLETQGDAVAALVEHRSALAIVETLAAHDPNNASWQSDLSASHDRVGDVLTKQGDLAGVLVEYSVALAIREHLATKDPSNASWQRELAASQGRVGLVLEAKGDTTGALAKYRAALAIINTLAARDLSNGNWQHDLALSHAKVGDFLLTQNDTAEASVEYRATLAIAERLATQDPSNAEWQRLLAASYDNIGNVLMMRGDVTAALTQFRAGLAISETLARRDPSNAVAQRDLAVSHDKMASVFAAQGDAAATRAEYRAALTIVEKLITQDPTSVQLKADLAELRGKLNGCCPSTRPK